MEWYQIVFGVIVGLLLLMALVVAHELGHAIAARRNGVVVEEFGIGFPPKVWSRKLKNGVLFTVNLLPLGGFVKLKGEYDAAREKGDYGAASFWAKTKILLAGVVANWLIAAVILTILALVGIPKILPDQFSVASDTTEVTSPVEIAAVGEGSAAEAAGIEVGDQILRFDGQTVATPEDLIQLAADGKGQTVEIIYLHAGQEISTKASLRDDNSDGAGYFGASVGQNIKLRSTWSAPIVGVVTTGQFTAATFQGVGDLLGNLASGVALKFSSDPADQAQSETSLAAVNEGVAGPIGILGIIFPQASQAGPLQVLYLTAIISLTLAVMNVLPIPGLDGGRWLTLALFRLFRQPLTKKREELIQMIGLSILFILIIAVTISDVGKLF